MSRTILVVCEGHSDFPWIETLVDRVVKATRPYEVARDGIGAIRRYVGLLDDNAVEQWPFVPFQHLGAFIDRFKQGKHRKQFIAFKKGFPAELPMHEDAKLFDLFFKILVASREEAPDVLLLVRDADSDDTRRAALSKLNQHYRKEGIAVIVGVPHPETECWLLAGFRHEMTDEEEKRLDEYKRGTGGVDPTRQSHQLNGPDESDPRHPKNALSELCPGVSRKNQCLNAPFDMLRINGKQNGLAEFLEALETRLIPRLFGGGSPPSH